MTGRFANIYSNIRLLLSGNCDCDPIPDVLSKRQHHELWTMNVKRRGVFLMARDEMIYDKIFAGSEKKKTQTSRGFGGEEGRNLSLLFFGSFKNRLYKIG